METINFLSNVEEYNIRATIGIPEIIIAMDNNVFLSYFNEVYYE